MAHLLTEDRRRTAANSGLRVTQRFAMSQEFGADPLLVAMMQYLRVIFVVLTASLVAGLWLGPEHPVSG